MIESYAASSHTCCLISNLIRKKKHGRCMYFQRRKYLYGLINELIYEYMD